MTAKEYWDLRVDLEDVLNALDELSEKAVWDDEDEEFYYALEDHRIRLLEKLHLQ